MLVVIFTSFSVSVSVLVSLSVQFLVGRCVGVRDCVRHGTCVCKYVYACVIYMHGRYTNRLCAKQCVYVYVYVCLCVCVRVRVRVCVRVCVCVYTNMKVCV